MKTPIKIMQSLRFMAILAGILLTAWSLLPAQDCSNAVLDAKNEYVNGHFEEVISIVDRCFGQLEDQEKQYALRYKAIAYIGLDGRDSALVAIKQLLTLNSNYEPNVVENPLMFMVLVKYARSLETREKVSSVSKKEEDVKKAPATVLVVDAKQILNRGYTDVEQILHDLPGFDISRSNGITYSSFYQRGYRTANNNDRSLMLLDGFEMNDLWSNNIWLSRQFPLSNLKRFEVVHGPASTMYGANAFVGTLNMVSKEVSDLISEGKNYGASGQFSFGSFNAKMGDVTVAARSGLFSAIVAARAYHSNEYDLSSFPNWDYKVDSSAYGKLSWVTNANTVRNSVLPLDSGNLVRYNADTTRAYLTDAGIHAALQRDIKNYEDTVGGAPIGFSDRTRNYYLSATVKYSGMRFGVVYFSSMEGSSWTIDRARAGYDNGNRWNPRQLMVYQRYDKALPNEKMYLSVLSSYKIHDLGPQSASVSTRMYENGNLTYLDLVRGRSPSWTTTYSYTFSTQMRNEGRFFYTINKQWDLIAGMESRISTIQGDYLTSPNPFPSDSGFINSSNSPLIPGGNTFKVFDFGTFSQLSYTPHKIVKIVAGGRYDYNQIRAKGGYGSQFNPRLVAIVTPKNWVAKMIYSEAFKDATSFDKYSIVPSQRDTANPNLNPEKVRNAEVVLGYELKSNVEAPVVHVEASGFYSNFNNIIGTALVKGKLQNQNVGKLDIIGGQFTASFKYRGLSLSGNYTYTSPWNTKPLDFQGNPELDSFGNPIKRQRIADIAPHKFNIILEAALLKRFLLNVRCNYSAARPVGVGTSLPQSGYSGDKIPAFFLTNLALSWTSARSGIMFQGVVNNLFDRFWIIPGVRTATGVFAPSIPQPGRNFSIKLVYNIHQP
jgi:outer membrane receptor for ferrienterochelin and colicins